MRLQPRRVSTGGHRPKTQITGPNSPNEVFGPLAEGVSPKKPDVGMFSLSPVPHTECMLGAKSKSRGCRTTPFGRGSVTFSKHDASILSRDQGER